MITRVSTTGASIDLYREEEKEDFLLAHQEILNNKAIWAFIHKFDRGHYPSLVEEGFSNGDSHQ